MYTGLSGLFLRENRGNGIGQHSTKPCGFLDVQDLAVEPVGQCHDVVDVERRGELLFGDDDGRARFQGMANTQLISGIEVRSGKFGHH